MHRTASWADPPSLAVESNHRIANHLGTILALVRREIGAISKGPAQVPRDQVLAALNGLAGRVAAVARLHQRLASLQAQGTLSLADLLRQMVEDFNSMFDGRLQLAVLRGVASVTAAQASLLTVIFCEIATNALKHAKPCGSPVELTIDVATNEDGTLMLRIADDGVGLPRDFVEERDAGIGVKLMKSLVEGAGGRLQMRSQGQGLAVSIQLPSSREASNRADAAAA